jgi:AcrR family transcriptional regulator
MYQTVHQEHKLPVRHKKAALDHLLDRCLAAFVHAGTLDLSLDQLARKVGTSKRMLVHYFGNRGRLEEKVMNRLEENLRTQFSPEAFPPGVTPEVVLAALWDRSTALESRGVLLLVMDLYRRAWSGSKRAKAFYAEQQRLWVALLTKFIPNQSQVEEILQLFQGGILAYLITGNREAGKRALLRALHAPR